MAYPKGQKLSLEHRLKLSMQGRAAYANPELRIKVGAAVKEAWGKLSGEQKRVRAAKQSGGWKNSSKTTSDEFIKNRSEKTRQQWARRTKEERLHITAPSRKAISARKNPSRLECLIERMLLVSGLPFLSQYRVGPYTADFYLPSRKAILECDGEYWHEKRPGAIERDAKRDQVISSMGYSIIRLKEKNIKQHAGRTLLVGLYGEHPDIFGAAQ